MSGTDITTPKITYRRTRNGKWVVCGPADYLAEQNRMGYAVEVTKRSGETVRVSLSGVGRSFDQDGSQMAYGYIDEDTTRYLQRGSSVRCHRGHARLTPGCWDCHDTFDV